MGKMARNKGARGEREVIDLLQPIVDKAYQEAYPTTLNVHEITPQLKRTSSMQADGGGCDVHGLPWLALEVKRCETLQIESWWRQCVQQAKDGQLPALAYRKNKCAWRVRLPIYTHVECGALIVDVSITDFVAYFTAVLKVYLQRSNNANL